MKLYGFTILKNGTKYDYSFKESLLSMAQITKMIYLALGDCDDETEKALQNLQDLNGLKDFLKIKHTIWDPNLRSGGLILSRETNVALNFLREDLRSNQSDDYNDCWGLYLQADEVIHQDENNQILKDILWANDNGYDAVRFRYLHFWPDHSHIAINKKWYPSEIRAIRLNTNIESWGDAQSFRFAQKVFDSDAHIFHCGHVREKDSYVQKKSDILKLYHSDGKLSKYKRREKKLDNQTEILTYLGTHPKVMKDRILRLGDQWEHPQRDLVYIVAERSLFSESLIEKINVKNIYFYKSKKELKNAIGIKIPKNKTIIFEPNWLDKFIYKDNIPSSMRSKLARPWSNDFILTLKLSQKGIALKSN
ncbi:MAG: hypothetical protein HQK51_01260 [Oligoflexia bacterium]|nr:hypothetical protein [Oligoflexia bacterium]